MEDFVKYLADIIEFLVGGILILLSLLIACYLFFPDQVVAAMGLLAGASDSLGLPIGFVVIGLVYGVGIIFEALSREIVEWRLTRVTVAVLVDALGVPTRDGAPLEGAELKKWAVDQREAWRRAVEADDAGRRAVVAQLSRLRVERVFLLASYIVLVAFAVRCIFTVPPILNWYAFGVLGAAAFSALLFHLVNVRFGRFVKEIMREQSRLHPSEAVRKDDARAWGLFSRKR